MRDEYEFYIFMQSSVRPSLPSPPEKDDVRLIFCLLFRFVRVMNFFFVPPSSSIFCWFGQYE